MRTTINTDDPILEELKATRRKEGKSPNHLISDLLAHALDQRKPEKPSTGPATWISKALGARIDPADRDALY